jgi:hypothetical protein
LGVGLGTVPGVGPITPSNARPRFDLFILVIGFPFCATKNGHSEWVSTHLPVFVAYSILRTKDGETRKPSDSIQPTRFPSSKVGLSLPIYSL